jgi:hypothetical protein
MISAIRGVNAFINGFITEYTDEEIEGVIKMEK